MTLHIPGYEIVVAPAGIVLLAVCFAMMILGMAAIVRIIRWRRRP